MQTSASSAAASATAPQTRLSPPPPATPPSSVDPVTVPPAIRTFFTNLLLRLRRGRDDVSDSRRHVSGHLPRQHREEYGRRENAEEQDDGPGYEQSCLPPAQLERLLSLLWQWLLLFSAPTEPTGDRTECRPPLPHWAPRDVEKIFHMGVYSLLPSATGEGCVGDERPPPIDPPAPWYNAETARRDVSPVLLRAIDTLRGNGPLFSSWCALCYTCVEGLSSSPLPSYVPPRGGKSDEPLALTSLRDAVTDAEEALRRLHHSWNAAVTKLCAEATEETAQCEGSFAIRALTESPDIPAHIRWDERAVVKMWCTLYTMRAVSAGDAASVAEGGVTQRATAPLPVCLWAAQWFQECCRVAAHGCDDGFHSDSKDISVSMMSRIAFHLFQRLKEEVLAEKLCETRWVDTRVLQTQVQPSLVKRGEDCDGGVTKETSRNAAPPLQHSNFATDLLPRKPPQTLKIGTLSALALHSPKQTADDGSCPVSGASLKRRRDREWTTDEDEEEGEGRGSDGGHGQPSRGALTRFLCRQRSDFGVTIASGVLTMHTMTFSNPHLSDEVGAARAIPEVSPLRFTPASPPYPLFCTPQLNTELHLRDGVVHWWTLSESRKHRQLLAERRTKPLS